MNWKKIWCELRGYHKAKRLGDFRTGLLGDSFIVQTCGCGAEQFTTIPPDFEPGGLIPINLQWELTNGTADTR